MSSPAARTVLSADTLAADFGPKTERAKHALGALADSFTSGPIPVAGDPQLFGIHTYYALLLKLIAALAVGKLPRATRLRADLSDLESGRLFRNSGLPDFLEGDLFAWYLPAWNRKLEAALAALVERVAGYVPPRQPEDLVKNLYQSLVPKETRRDWGEHYTRDWLAEQLLEDTLGPALGDATQRVLDPACGSGTFLVLLIRHIRRRLAAGTTSPREALDRVLGNVIGFDVNPLTVLAARTNYLFALGDLLHARGAEIQLPVFLADAARETPQTRRFTGSCDYVVGNPPWVNWERLPEAYRRASQPLWEHYGLFPRRKTAMQTILGGAKYDLSMLLTYTAADRYLREHGKLGFVVSQTLFKSAGAGQGFRLFVLPDGTPLAPRLVRDLVQLRPFEGVANRTATVVLEKGRAVEYPVDYRYSDRSGRTFLWHAQPVSAADPTSAWISARPRALAALTRILGTSTYRGREGTNTGGANGVFWVETAGPAAAGRREIRNLTQGARKPVPAVRTTVEAGLVYPLLRGQNVRRWSAEPASSILLTHEPGMQLRAIPEAVMKDEYPLAFSYLKRFRKLLAGRPAFKRYFKASAPFYSIFNLGDYTFSPWKVVWREQAFPFTAAVADPVEGGMVIPDHKLMLVAVRSASEAHYLCGALNSLAVSAAVAAYAIEIQIDTHVLQHIHVPAFDRRDPVHRQLSSWSRQAHAAVRTNDADGLAKAEAAIQRWSARLWGFSEDDLREMRQFLAETGLSLDTPKRANIL